MTSPPIDYSANVRAEVARAHPRTQQDVATAAGIPWSNWTRRMSNRTPWTADELRAVALALDIPVATLWGSG